MILMVADNTFLFYVSLYPLSTVKWTLFLFLQNLIDIQYKSHLAFSEEFVVYITKSLPVVLYYRFVFFKIDKHNVFDLIKFVFYWNQSLYNV